MYALRGDVARIDRRVEYGRMFNQWREAEMNLRTQYLEAFRKARLVHNAGGSFLEFSVEFAEHFDPYIVDRAWTSLAARRHCDYYAVPWQARRIPEWLPF